MNVCLCLIFRSPLRLNMSLLLRGDTDPGIQSAASSWRIGWQREWTHWSRSWPPEPKLTDAWCQDLRRAEDGADHGGHPLYFFFLKTRNCWLRCYWTTAGNKSPLWMTDWHRAPAHTWDSQPVSSEGVKINIPIRKTSVQAVKSTVTQHEERGAKQSFPLRTHIVVLMNLLKLMELWTNKEVTGSGQHQEFCFC